MPYKFSIMSYEKPEKPEKIFIHSAIQMERPWLRTIFPTSELIDYTYESPSQFFLKHKLPEITFVIWGQYTIETETYIIKLFDILNKQNVNVNLIQLSDEGGYLTFFFIYEHKAVKSICRNYIYPYTERSFTEKAIEKISIFPLGPIHFSTETLQKHKTFEERKYVWSFAGQDIMGRKYEVGFLENAVPNYLKFYDGFFSSDRLNSDEYTKLLGESKFIPILCGCNPETFRFYEALEFGAIPLYVRQADDEEFWKFLKHIFPDIIEIPSWNIAKGMLCNLESYKSLEEWEKYRFGFVMRWKELKADPQQMFVPVSKLLGSSLVANEFHTQL